MKRIINTIIIFITGMIAGGLGLAALETWWRNELHKLNDDLIKP